MKKLKNKKKAAAALPNSELVDRKISSKAPQEQFVGETSNQCFLNDFLSNTCSCHQRSCGAMLLFARHAIENVKLTEPTNAIVSNLQKKLHFANSKIRTIQKLMKKLKNKKKAAAALPNSELVDRKIS